MTKQQQHIIERQKKRSHSLIISLLLLLNIFNKAHGRIGEPNIFFNDDGDVSLEYNDDDDNDDDEYLEGDFIIIFPQSTDTISVMSADDVTSLADDIGNSYALERKMTFYESLYGFTASNMTKTDLKKLQNDNRVLVVERDGIISVDPMELIDETDDEMTHDDKENDDDDDTTILTNRTNRILQQQTDTTDLIFDSETTNSEIIPPGVAQVGWRNIESNDDLMSRRIFVIDSGVSNPDDDLNIDTILARNFVTGENEQEWTDCNGHGTHVAGTIAARQNGRDVIGVAAGAIIVPIRVLDCTANGSISQVVIAINYVARHAFPGDVVNLSIGGPVDQRAIDIALEKAARTTGAKFVVAAGNGSTDARTYSPARAQGENIYTVCALNGNARQVASFSNFGKPPVEVCAPGTGIVSLSRHGGTAKKSGTSMAAPHVSGALLFGDLKTEGLAKSNRDGKRYRIVTR